MAVYILSVIPKSFVKRTVYLQTRHFLHLSQFQGCRAPLQAWTAHFANNHVTMLFTSACSQVNVISQLVLYQVSFLICNYEDLSTKFAFLVGTGYGIRLLATHEGSSVTLRK